MLVHEGDRFFQWLEGPPEALETLWTSIRQDDRHEEVEILGEGVTPARLFSGWDLRFLERTRSDATAAVAEPRAVEPTTEVDPALLARFALAGDDEAVAELLRSRYAGGRDAEQLCRELLEPAAHQLGDWWCEDVCDSFQVTVALSRLQSLVRRLDAQRPEPRRVMIEGRRVLVSPPPSETHMLGATVLGGFFHRAGWSVQAEFPQNDEDLIGLVSSHWFDALALTLSDVFTRRERLSALIKTITEVRAASRNPAMAVLVGGRAFRMLDEQPAERVGADVHYTSASDAVGDLDHWLFMRRFSLEGGERPGGDDDVAPLRPLDVVRIIAPHLSDRLRRGVRTS
jgi:methanogenic corrinoid protein MtbC1